MHDAWKVILNQARPVPCGNTWDTLDGDGKARHCAACNRQVHNLAALTPEGFEALQAAEPDRLCVVWEPSRRFLPLFAKPFAAVISLILLCQLAGAQEKQAPELRRCQDYLYTPMFIPPETRCLDEAGKPVESGPWLRNAYDEIRRREADHLPEKHEKP